MSEMEKLRPGATYLSRATQSGQGANQGELQSCALTARLHSLALDDAVTGYRWGRSHRVQMGAQGPEGGRAAPSWKHILPQSQAHLSCLAPPGSS